MIKNNFKTTNSKKRGFTLIELLVTSTIIIVLSAIGMVSFASAGKNARDSKRKADLETVRQALVLYKTEVGNYPTGAYTAATNTLKSQGFLSDPLPRDPKSSNSYDYKVSGSQFCLCASAEGTGTHTKLGTAAGVCTAGTGSYFCVSNP